jgi:hypothetical protein
VETDREISLGFQFLVVGVSREEYNEREGRINPTYVKQSVAKRQVIKRE